MESFYLVMFAGLVCLCVVLELSKQRDGKIVSDVAFRAFRNNYLLVYALMMAGDWLQVRRCHGETSRETSRTARHVLAVQPLAPSVAPVE